MSLQADSVQSRGSKHSSIGSRRHRSGMKDIVSVPGSEGTRVSDKRCG